MSGYAWCKYGYSRDNLLLFLEMAIYVYLYIQEAATSAEVGRRNHPAVKRRRCLVGRNMGVGNFGKLGKSVRFLLFDSTLY